VIAGPRAWHAEARSHPGTAGDGPCHPAVGEGHRARPGRVRAVDQDGPRSPGRASRGRSRRMATGR
jgi:hypothetical protein